MDGGSGSSEVRVWVSLGVGVNVSVCVGVRVCVGCWLCRDGLTRKRTPSLFRQPRWGKLLTLNLERAAQGLHAAMAMSRPRRARRVPPGSG